MPMRSPRMARIFSGERLSRSWPSNMMRPPKTRDGGLGSRRMIDMAVTLLPQPDSPTSPMVLPASSAKLVSSTTRSGSSARIEADGEVLDGEQAHSKTMRGK